MATNKYLGIQIIEESDLHDPKGAWVPIDAHVALSVATQSHTPGHTQRTPVITSYHTDQQVYFLAQAPMY